jgi:hypothetical protein
MRTFVKTIGSLAEFREWLAAATRDGVRVVSVSMTAGHLVDGEKAAAKVFKVTYQAEEPQALSDAG